MIMLWFIVGWFGGIFAGSFFLIQSLIIIFFGFANVIKMKNSGALALESRANLAHLISLLLLVGLLALSWYFARMYNHNIEVGFYVGVASVILLSLKGIFNNKNNRAEFIEKNIKYINPEFLTQYVDHLYETETNEKWLTKHIDTLEQRSGFSLRLFSVDVYILDTLKQTPFKETWTVGKDISRDQAEKFFNDEDDLIYVIRFYDDGESKEMAVTKEFFFDSLNELSDINKKVTDI